MDDASWVRVGYYGIPWELGISDLARRLAFLPSIFLPISLASWVQNACACLISVLGPSDLKGFPVSSHGGDALSNALL